MITHVPPLWRIDPRYPDESVLKEVAHLLRKGGIVVYPTETFYGVGASLEHPAALRRVFQVKRRPKGSPLLLLIGSVEMLEGLVSSIPLEARVLMERFWPGPLTIILPAREGLPEELIGPGGGVAVRWTKNPIAQGIIRALGSPITGTSANISGGKESIDPKELPDELIRGVDGIVNGGRTPGGPPSTLVDLLPQPPRLLREGAIRREDMEPLLRKPLIKPFP